MADIPLTTQYDWQVKVQLKEKYAYRVNGHNAILTLKPGTISNNTIVAFRHSKCHKQCLWHFLVESSACCPILHDGLHTSWMPFIHDLASYSPLTWCMIGYQIDICTCRLLQFSITLVPKKIQEFQNITKTLQKCPLTCFVVFVFINDGSW